jgi:hypothetical protein
MILSAHRFTGFWFESDRSNGQDINEESASKFLAASLERLRKSNSAKGQAKGAINTGFDPARLSSHVPGYGWLKERLQWMKRSFPDFDDKPGGLLKDSKRGRNPFPAFHSSIRYSIGGRALPLDGVEILIGHDFVVIHEFSILSKTVSDPEETYAKLIKKRFGAPPEPSSTLFTAAFCQLSGRDANKPINNWSAGEFAAGDFPGIKLPLRCAVRGDEQGYQGCVLVGGSSSPKADSPGKDLYCQIEDHLNATGYLKFFCILLVNDAKVRYEYAVASPALKGLKHNLDTRLREAETLNRARLRSRRLTSSQDSVDALRAAHWADAKLIDYFDQLVTTCTINAEQFAKVASQLMESDNRWSAAARRRLNSSSDKLGAAQLALRNRFRNTAEKINNMPQPQGDRHEPQLSIRDQIFVSYAHEDKKWLKELKTHLSPVLRKHKLFGSDETEMIWDDTRIRPGDKWMNSIKAALARAKAAILLVTPDFLDSDFINREEIPKLLLAEKKEGLMVLWIHISACNYKFSVLEGYQCLHDSEKPLDDLGGRPKRNKEWVKICAAINKSTGLWTK